MHNLRAKNHWTSNKTVTAAGNRTCIITLQLSDFKSQASLSQWKRFIFSNQPIENQDIYRPKNKFKPVKSVKPTKNSTRPYLNDIFAHFIHEINTKGYDVIGVNVCHSKSLLYPQQNGLTGASLDCTRHAFYHSITGIKRLIFDENFTFLSKQSLSQSDSE